jgi:cytidylate kinase
MDIITISRQLGSLGFQVGQAVAARLNYRLVWRDLINQAAIRSGAPEMALALIDELNLLGVTHTEEQFRTYVKSVEQVIHELAAERSIVIVGRAGQIVLRDEPLALHVRICAPLPVRIQRIADYRGISPEAARAQCLASDRSRKNYLNQAYGENWEDPGLYDLTLNTARMSIQTAADILCQTASQSFEVSPIQYSAKKGEIH